MNLESKASDYIQDEKDIFEDIEINNNVPEKQHFKFFDFLKSKTGEGDINSYIEHPLNFDKSSPIAQILRGLTGILGNIDLGIIDIGLGLLKFFQNKKVADV